MRGAQGMPGERYGMHVGDVVLSVEGVLLESATSLTKLVEEAGEYVHFELAGEKRHAALMEARDACANRHF